MALRSHLILLSEVQIKHPSNEAKVTTPKYRLNLLHYRKPVIHIKAMFHLLYWEEVAVEPTMAGTSSVIPMPLPYYGMITVMHGQALALAVSSLYRKIN